MEPIPIVIDSRVRVPCARLPERIQVELCALFVHENPKRKALEHMGIPCWNEPKEFVNWGACRLTGPVSAQRPAWIHAARDRIRKGDESDVWLTFPRGGLAKVREVLTREGLLWEHVDQRSLGSDALLDRHGHFPDLRVEMRPYQDQAIGVMHSKQNVLVRGSVGCGKTEAAFGLLHRVGRPALVVVHSAVLFNQWRLRAKKVFGMAEKAIGVVKGSKRKVGLITIAMQQSLTRMSDDELEVFLRDFGVMIVDEAQSAAARTVYRIVNTCPAKWRVAITDSDSRKDKLQFLIHDLFGQSQHEISREEMIAGGFVMEVVARIVPTDFEAPWYGLDSDREQRKKGDKEVDFNRLLDEMRADEDRNALAIEHSARAALEGRPTIVMTHRRDHALLLEAEISARGVATGLVIGGDDYAVAFRDTIKKFRAGKIRCAVGTVQAVGTGLDLPLAEVGMVATPVGGNKQLARQVWGRFCRNADGKEGATLYVLWDRHVYPRHLSNFLAWYPVVEVWDGEAWVPGREYQRARRQAGGI